MKVAARTGGTEPDPPEDAPNSLSSAMEGRPSCRPLEFCQRLNIVDYGTVAYNGVVLALVLLFHARVPQWPLQILPNLIAIAVVLGLARGVGDRAALVPAIDGFVPGGPR